MNELPEIPLDGKRRATLAIWALGLSIAVNAAGLIGCTLFWFSLPEKLSNYTQRQDDHERRIRELEAGQSSIKETLGRIDERTKGISDSMSDLKRTLKP